MSLPQTTPLILASDYANMALGGDMTNAARILKGIIRASDFFQRKARRRFDECIKTVKYTATLEREGGNLLDSRTLMLDDDLKSINQFYQRVPVGATDITQGQIIIANTYRMTPDTPMAGSNIIAYDTIYLNSLGGVYFMPGGVDAIESIWINGLWGYGGQWLTLGTLVTDIDASTTSLTLTGTEAGMTLKIDTEYLYLDVAGSPNTVVRAVNGSIAATHLSGSTIYRWEALDSVQDYVARLVQWRVEQIKSPAMGNAVLGDFSFPADITGLPKDLYIMMRDCFLNRIERTVGV